MKHNITIFYGGVDDEKEVSMASMKTVQENLDTSKYNISLVEVMSDGTWSSNGQPIDQDKALALCEYAFIAMHGAYGEDGTLQKILSEYHVPHNGTGALMSQIAFSKSATKELFEKIGLQTPAYETHMLTDQNLDSLAGQIFQTFPQPCVIKPDAGGSSFGVSIAETKEDIKTALEGVAQLSDKVIIEQYIVGCEATTGVVERMRGEVCYALPPVEIIPQNQFFDYKAKYHGQVEEICPATFDGELKEELQTIAVKVHQELGLGDYSRTDFMIHPTKGVYVLEVNTLPELMQKGLWVKMLDAVGVTISEFIETCIENKQLL